MSMSAAEDELKNIEANDDHSVATGENPARSQFALAINLAASELKGLARTATTLEMSDDESEESSSDVGDNTLRSLEDELNKALSGTAKDASASRVHILFNGIRSCVAFPVFIIVLLTPACVHELRQDSGESVPFYNWILFVCSLLFAPYWSRLVASLFIFIARRLSTSLSKAHGFAAELEGPLSLTDLLARVEASFMRVLSSVFALILWIYILEDHFNTPYGVLTLICYLIVCAVLFAKDAVVCKLGSIFRLTAYETRIRKVLVREMLLELLSTAIYHYARDHDWESCGYSEDRISRIHQAITTLLLLRTRQLAKSFKGGLHDHPTTSPTSSDTLMPTNPQNNVHFPPSHHSYDKHPAHNPKVGKNGQNKHYLTSNEAKQVASALFNVLVDTRPHASTDGECLDVYPPVSKTNEDLDQKGDLAAHAIFRTKLSPDPDRKHKQEITKDDLMRFVSPQASRSLLRYFDITENASVSLTEISVRVKAFHREKRSLLASLGDVGSIIQKLDTVLTIVIWVALLIIILYVFDVNVSNLWITFSASILGLAFVFGETFKDLFKSIIFLFVSRPFDVGDKVIVEDEIMYVKQLALFSTTFVKWNNEYIYFPNSLLLTKRITNLRRSESMWIEQRVSVASSVSTTTLKLLERRIRIALKYELSLSLHFLPNFDLVVLGADGNCSISGGRIDLTCWVQMRLNWQDGNKWKCASRFYMFLRNLLEELKIPFWVNKADIPSINYQRGCREREDQKHN